MERIDRKNDEHLYQPAIHSERIRALYQIKLITGLPLTVIVDIALKDFISEFQVSDQQPKYERQTDRGI